MDLTEPVTSTAMTTLIDERGEHTRGLTILRRAADVALTAGSRGAVRLNTDARVEETGLELRWSEAYVVDTAGGALSVVKAQIPADRIAALRAGRPLRWPAPSARPSTRAIAGVIAQLARTGGPAAAEPVDVVARYIEEFKNQSRFTVFPKLFGPDFRHHFDFPGRGPGFESFMSVGRDLLGSFKELHVTVDDLFGEGELVVESNTVHAVHRGDFAGVAGTGRPVTWTEIHFYRVVAGRIVENWPTVDVERLVGSLG